MAGGDLQCFFGWKDDSGVILQDRRRSAEYHFPERGTNNSYVLRSTAVSPQSSWSEKGIKSRTARGYLSNGMDKCQGASWSGEFDGKELREALGGERNLELRGAPFPGHRLPILFHRRQYGMLISKCSPCTAVMQYSSTSYDFFVSLSLCSHVSVMRFRKFAFRRPRVAFLTLKAKFFFQEGLSPRTHAASYSRRVFDWE